MERVLDQRLNKKMKTVWRISDGVMLLVIALPTLAIMQGIWLAGGQTWASFVFFVTLAIFAALLMLVLFVIPSVRYVRWRYEISEDYLEIQKGIIWRKHYLIPFIRVQNTDTSQGPVLRALGLASVSVSTAAGEHVIPGLDVAMAGSLRDKVAELARLAREDL